jgi:hypothetical protein
LGRFPPRPELGVVSERASRERDLVASHAPVATRAETAQPKRTAAEHAYDVIVVFSREIGDLRATLDEVREAHAANDPDRWMQARGRVDSMLVTAHRSLDRARSQAVDATPDALARLAATESELELLRKSCSSLDDAPSGFATVPGETEILAAFDAPLEGGFRLGFEKKESMLKARFDRLAPAERRVVADRVRRSRPNDPIAAAFSRLSETRRRHLLEYLASAGRREAQQSKGLLGANDASEPPPAEAPQATPSTDATPDLRPNRSPSTRSCAGSSKPVPSTPRSRARSPTSLEISTARRDARSPSGSKHIDPVAATRSQRGSHGWIARFVSGSARGSASKLRPTSSPTRFATSSSRRPAPRSTT